MMRRKCLLCVISVSAAATISDGSSGACSAAAAFVPPPTFGPSVPQRTVHPCSQPNRTCRIRRLHQTLLRDKLSAFDESTADDGRGPTSPASSLLQSILLDQSIEDISDRISSRIVLPFHVPQPIISAATTLAVQQLTTDVLSLDLLERIGEVAVTSSSTTTASATELMDDDDDDDGVPDNEEIDSISDQIAIELNAQIDLPVLDEEQELVIFQAIGRALMAVLTTPDEIEVDPKQVVDLAVETAQELLEGKEGRSKLAQVLNEKLDFPILNEEAEQDLLDRALDACADRLLEVLPREMVDALKGESNYEGLESTKGFIVASINRKVDIIGLTEDQEAQLVAMLVDMVVDLVIGDTELEFLLMNPEERISALQEREVALRRQLEITKKRHEAELTNLEAQIRRIEERINVRM